MTTVIDASAMLAFLFGEKGHERVATELADCCMTTVNLCEVLGRFARDGHSPGAVISRLRATSVQWIPFDETLCVIAAGLVPQTRRLGLSLGDRACIALGKMRGLPVLTADLGWNKLDLGVEILCIR